MLSQLHYYDIYEDLLQSFHQGDQWVDVEQDEMIIEFIIHDDHYIIETYIDGIHYISSESLFISVPQVTTYLCDSDGNQIFELPWYGGVYLSLPRPYWDLNIQLPQQ